MVDTKKKAKEQQQQREKEGNEFIQQREQTANKLTSAQVPNKRTLEQASSIVAGKSVNEQVGEALNQKAVIDATAQAITEEDARRIQEARKTDPTQLGQLNEEQKRREIVIDDGVVGTTAKIAGGLKGAATGAAIGAGVGSVVPLVGTAVGTAAGAGIGFVAGSFKVISADEKQNVKKANAVFVGAKNNLGWIINEANAGRISRADAIKLYDEQIANLNAAERTLKERNSDPVLRLLSEPQEELAKVYAFKDRLPFIKEQVDIATLAPNPSAMPVNFVDSEEQGVLNG